MGEPRNKNLMSIERFCEYFSVIQAVDQATINTEKINLRNRFPKFNNSSYLSAGEFACAQSHMLALESYLDLNEKYKFCLILEDDALFLSDLELTFAKLRSLTSSKMESNTIIHCGGMEGMKLHYYFKLRNLLSKKPITTFETQFLYRASSYIVNRHSAKIYLDFLRAKPPVVADDWYDLARTTSVNIRTTNIFSHPLDLRSSSLEASRHGS